MLTGRNAHREKKFLLCQFISSENNLVHHKGHCQEDECHTARWK